ncbi:hypothetical protein H1P_3690008 [Hyella patelloides LEGE 07179]|uniref:Uncharacterized protein n=1 Tax=Hyella patelloides LEGE 07179 TaxID=945734 RepID=A0A563VWK6_9CYAN|nr:hypothetical protein [Hyella patelloides]VEP15775.1 hypothetical protein H1P_3690008 [Hyella patelloides LEGE 07179]
MIRLINRTKEVTEYQWDYRNRLIAVVNKDITGNAIAYLVGWVARFYTQHH